MQVSIIEFQITVDYAPLENGLAERMYRTFMEKAKSMLVGAVLPNSFLGQKQYRQPVT